MLLILFEILLLMIIVIAVMLGILFVKAWAIFAVLALVIWVFFGWDRIVRRIKNFEKHFWD